MVVRRCVIFFVDFANVSIVSTPRARLRWVLNFLPLYCAPVCVGVLLLSDLFGYLILVEQFEMALRIEAVGLGLRKVFAKMHYYFSVHLRAVLNRTNEMQRMTRSQTSFFSLGGF